MLVIDRVELITRQQPQKVRTLDRGLTCGLSSRAIPATKSLISGTWASTLLATTRSAFSNSAARATPKKRSTVSTLARAASAVAWVGSIPGRECRVAAHTEEGTRRWRPTPPPSLGPTPTAAQPTPQTAQHGHTSCWRCWVSVISCKQLICRRMSEVAPASNWCTQTP